MSTNNNNVLKTLVILAAGNGSRFGGAKQFATFGKKQWTLMQYNMANATKAGINHFVFIVQQKHIKALEEQVVKKLEAHIKYDIVVQCNDFLPKSCKTPKQTKPLGTAHAIWCCHKVVTNNFAVINGDDYYGKNAFSILAKANNTVQNQHFLLAFLLNKTLSENGGVNRGLCQLNQNRFLTYIEEYEKIQAQHSIITGVDQKNLKKVIQGSELVSMNCWSFTPAIFDALERLLVNTFSEAHVKDIESYLPTAVMNEITNNKEAVKILTSDDNWFGITYAEDVALVEKELK